MSEIYKVRIATIGERGQEAPPWWIAWLPACSFHKSSTKVVVLEDVDPNTTPTEAKTFKFEIDKLNYLINHALQAARYRESCIEMLEQAAKEGVEKGLDLSVGYRYINLLKDHMISKASHDRTHFTNRINLGCLIVFAISTLGVVFGSRQCSYHAWCDADLFKQITAFMYALIGMSVAVSLSSTIRLRKIEFSMLSKFDPYMFKVYQRLTYISLLIVGMMLILGFNIIKLGVGNILLNDFRVDPKLGILIGLVAGASEPAFASIFERVLQPRDVEQRASEGT